MSEFIDGLTEMALGGNVAAQYHLACLYLNGDEGIERNEEEGWRWCQSAAEGGNADAQLQWGSRLAYKYNKLSESFEMIEKSAEQGEAKAQCLLSNYYINGDGVEVNYLKALKWAKLAADQGNPEAIELKNQLETVLGGFA